MTILFPFFKFYKRYSGIISIGMTLALLTLLASVFLLSLSGWFLAGAAVAGFSGAYTFNYMLPAVGVRGAAITRTASRYAERLVSHNTTFKILAFLRVLAFETITPLSPGQLENYQKSDLLNRFIADIDNLDHFYLKLLSPFITALVVIVAIYFGIHYFNPTLAYCIASALLLTTLSIPLLFYRVSKPVGEILIHYKSDYRNQIITYLQGQHELAVFDALFRFRHALDETENKWLALQKKQAVLIHLAQSMVILIVGFLTLLTIWLSIKVGLDYHSPILALIVFVCLASNEILAPLPNAFIYLGQVVASAKRITELFQEKPDIIFKKTNVNAITSPFSVTIENMAFQYPKQLTPVLTAISIILEPKQHIALIGKTGCGKSTLLKLITRGASPLKGQIYFNHIPISDFDEPSLRRMIAVVPQQIDILNDTLRNNLLIANESANDPQLIEALHQVGLTKLLHDPDGLSLWLGDSGRSLSGGETRRVGIARALLHKSPLILMDEPTESLDVETEKQMIALIRHVYKDKTLLMATHRLTNHQMFDTIYRLEDGNLIRDSMK